jgi:8-oxo-dGTP pyrophosphatase MutT (NUDIX family)
MNKIIIASGPVIVEENKVLLNKHGDTTFFKFCGGKAETLEEDLQEIARREAKEEMGIDIEITDSNPFITYTTKKTIEGIIDVILVHFLAERKGDINPNSEIREWRWIDLDKLENEDLAPNIIPVLKYFKFI